MRIVYVASDQRVPGRTGGSVHVLEVARGLAARGHEVHAVVHQEAGVLDEEDRDGVVWHRIAWRPGHRLFRFRARSAVERLLAVVRPQALMERYYNFGGEGILAAEEAGIPSLLEVNSPAVDHPGSLKAALDTLALVHPLRRRRERLCRAATALVSPLVEIVPDFARGKTVKVSWGANVDAFHPSRRRAEVRDRHGVPEGAVVVLFVGSFRPWHGVHVLEAAARRLSHRAGLYFLLAGGPHAAEGAGYRGRRLGSLAYEQMPELVASSDVGAAPYDTRRLRQLRLGFYWSPLKIFEYMASGLPTVTIARAPLDEIVREEGDGLHFREGDDADLARVLARLESDASLRARLGMQARARVVECYSWARHCEQLEGVLRRIAS
jgi:glycosyltransferase involved in cell wall biosynthesis